ncbi:MAG: GNAT family N-acetyltransferase, partial [Thermomicrobiales bacterium]|nr:GNAT family N-acetyltransferase [Thermomicrobiales bacterium]
MAWWPSPFPAAVETLEDLIKKQIPQGMQHQSTRLVICRRSDGRPIGSALIDEGGGIEAEVRLHLDPTLGSAAAEAQGEAIHVILPWLAGERYRPMIRTAIAGGQHAVRAAAEAVGMRPAVRLREGVLHAGQRQDLYLYDYLNPIWTAQLGDPGIGIAAERDRPENRVPPRRSLPGVPVPQNAFIGSERLALRPFNKADAELMARTVRQESDAGFGHSRFPIGAVIFADWFTEIGKENPSSEMEVAVVLRESGEIIGEVGLYDINWLARSAETGSWLYKAEHRGSGYGTEAKLLLLEYAFEWLGLNMLWSWVKEANPRSQAALRKQGYRDAGVTHWSGLGPTGFESARMFDLLANEWFAGQES